MARFLIRLFSLLSLLLAVCETMAQPMIVLSGKTSTLPVANQIVYAQLPQNQTFAYLENLSVPEQVHSLIKTSTFRRAGTRGLNFGATNDNFLFRFRLRRADTQPTAWLLTLHNPAFVSAYWYVVDAGGRISARKINTFRKTGASDLYGSCAAWPIALADSKPVTVYLLCIGGSVPRHFPFELTTANEFQRSTTRDALFWGGYFGLMLALLLYNTLVFWSVRDRNYFFYCLLLISHLLFQLRNSGYGLRFVWWEWPIFNMHSPLFVAGFTLFAGISFSVVFLETKRYAPHLHLLMVVFAAQALIMASLLTVGHGIGHLVGFNPSENYWIMTYFGLVMAFSIAFQRWQIPKFSFLQPHLSTLFWLNAANLSLVGMGEIVGHYSTLGIISAAAALVLCTWAGFAAQRNGNPNALFYLVAWGSLLASVAVYILYMAGTWPYHFLLANVVVFGSSAEALLLALALANRIRVIRQEREQSLSDLVAQMADNQRQQARLLAVRHEIARDLHDDMGSRLSSISILSQNIERIALQNPALARQYLTRLGETARQVIDSMGDIVWSINPEMDGLPQVAERMRDFAAEILEPLPTQLDFCLDENLAQTALPPAKRYDFYLIFKEAITNAARYAQADIIHVRLERQPDGLQLTVRDDGVGFDCNNIPPTKGGNGLKNMRVRAGKIGARLEVVSVVGQGTAVVMRLPLG